MVKKRVDLFLSKSDLEYLNQLRARHTHLSTRTRAIEYLISHYREQQGLKLELPEPLVNRAEQVYNSVIPLVFGCLFAYFFFMRSWVFLPFLVVAFFPLVFKVRVTDNIITVMGV